MDLDPASDEGMGKGRGVAGGAWLVGRQEVFVGFLVIANEVFEGGGEAMVVSKECSHGDVEEAARADALRGGDWDLILDKERGQGGDIVERDSCPCCSCLVILDCASGGAGDGIVVGLGEDKGLETRRQVIDVTAAEAHVEDHGGKGRLDGELHMGARRGEV